MAPAIPKRTWKRAEFALRNSGLKVIAGAVCRGETVLAGAATIRLEVMKTGQVRKTRC
ncbi:MAG: hypothetical protein ACYS74_01085 [Planctomycetota bacterium]